jgi:competence protein ComEA
MQRGGHALPEPPARWRLDASALRGLASLGLAALAGALVVVVAGWPRGTEVTQPVREQRAAQVLSEPEAAKPAVIIVDVDGEVRRPGVVELADGDRVIDALEAAGGVLRRGDTGALNLAEVLLDGQQVVVPRRGDSTGATTDPASGASSGASTDAPTDALVNLNTADEAALDTLPGIGPVLAAAIVEWRTQNGGFTSIEQLQEVSGIGPTTFAELAPLVRV